MRDPSRIDRIIELLRQHWHTSPDQRLGQLIANLHYGLVSHAVEDDHTHLLLLSKRAGTHVIDTKNKIPYRFAYVPACDHGLTFDESTAQHMDRDTIRKCYPRLDGECPKACGFNGITYVSVAHFLGGEW